MRPKLLWTVKGQHVLWDNRFIELAEHIAQWSKDPSTKCGAVIVRPDKTIASMGFNGFPRKINDRVDRLNDRNAKLDRVVHAEMNALLFLRERADGYTMYVWPMLPCNRCAVHIIQSGISHVVYPNISIPHWEDSMKITMEVFMEAGVTTSKLMQQPRV